VSPFDHYTISGYAHTSNVAISGMAFSLRCSSFLRALISHRFWARRFQVPTARPPMAPALGWHIVLPGRSVFGRGWSSLPHVVHLLREEALLPSVCAEFGDVQASVSKTAVNLSTALQPSGSFPDAGTTPPCKHLVNLLLLGATTLVPSTAEIWATPCLCG